MWFGDKVNKIPSTNWCIKVDNTPQMLLCWWVIVIFFLQPDMAGSVDNVQFKTFTLKKELYGSFLWIKFNCLETTDPLGGDSLLFATRSPELPDTLWSTSEG